MGICHDSSVIFTISQFSALIVIIQTSDIFAFINIFRMLSIKCAACSSRRQFDTGFETRTVAEQIYGERIRES